MKAPSRPTKETAEMLAIQALAFMAEDPERLGAFLGGSGLTVEGIRDAAREPSFLCGVLDHMLGNESLLMAFADSAGIDPAEVARARGALGTQWRRDIP
jgi:Protein of unknown function (DUF3572)